MRYFLLMLLLLSGLLVHAQPKPILAAEYFFVEN